MNRRLYFWATTPTVPEPKKGSSTTPGIVLSSPQLHNYLLSHSSLAITLTTLNFGQECFRLGIIAPRALDLVLNKATINPSSQDSVGQANQPFSAKIPGKSSIPQQNLSRYSFFIFPLFFLYYPSILYGKDIYILPIGADMQELSLLYLWH